MSKAFACGDVDSVDCPSSWLSNRSCQDNGAQTSGITFEESGVQSITSTTVEVQTDVSEKQGPGSADMTKLAAWLSKITPRVIEELEKNGRSRVFDEYKLQDTMDCCIKHLYTIGLEQSHPQYNFRTSAVDWSSTGGMLVIGRCAKEHSSWCDHPGSVFLHQTNRQEKKSELPYRLLDVSSCVTAVSAHPNESFILACGTYSGEVIVWNLQRDDPIVIGNMTLHSEAVVHMEWVQNYGVTNARPVLASASRDGSVIIWTMKTSSNTLKASQCFVLQTEKDATDLGIICAKFNPSNSSQFLAGVEGGSVAICSTDSRRPCQRKRALSNKDLDCCDPVLNFLDGHKGTVTGVQWVPGSKDLFLSCGTDLELRVYSLTDLSVLRIIHLPQPSCGLEIISSHPNIAVTWSSSGAIHLHDVHTAKMLPPLDMDNGIGKIPLSVVRVRTSSSQLFALGSSEGKVFVWQVPHVNFSNNCT